VNAVYSVSAVVLTLFVWLCAFKLIPDCGVSFYRYRLWRLRDTIVDEIDNGDYHDAAQAQAVVRVVEKAIEAAPELTVLKLTLLRFAVGNLPPPEPVDLTYAHPADRERLAAHLHTLDEESMSHAFRETPSGWFVTILLIPVFLLVELWERLRGRGGPHDEGSVLEGAKLHVKEIELVDPAFAIAGHSHNGDGRKGRKALYRGM
jgi:hypothetical protein